MLRLILLSIGLISANLPYITTVIVDNQNDANSGKYKSKKKKSRLERFGLFFFIFYLKLKIQYY